MDDLLQRYNYPVFAKEYFEPLMNWDASPAIGSSAPDFPLWTIDMEETSLSATWSAYKYLVVEFGSFT